MYQRMLSERANLDTFYGAPTPPQHQQLQPPQQQMPMNMGMSQMNMMPPPQQQMMMPPPQMTMTPQQMMMPPQQQQMMMPPQQMMNAPMPMPPTSPNMRPQLPPPSVMIPQGSQAPHPSVVATFMALDPSAQQRFAAANPVAYAQIYNALPVSAAPLHVTSQQQQAPVVLEKKKYLKPTKTVRVREPISESDNFHSSDEELNVKPQIKVIEKESPPPSAPSALSHHLPIDFRNNLRQITDQGYVLSIPPRAIREIELESCIINRMDVLEREPYIYISILELPGDYQLIGEGNTIIPVFGKLIQEKTMNEFIFYRPDHCKKVFRHPVSLNTLTVNFLNYEQQPISLSKINVRDLSRGKNYCKLRTSGPHSLSAGDSINVSYKAVNRVTVDSLLVLDIPEPDKIITEPPIRDIVAEDHRCSFDRIPIKCSLTFRIS
jgi:hypothetical protein